MKMDQKLKEQIAPKLFFLEQMSSNQLQIAHLRL